jgi:hypothetical protein
VRRAGRQQRRGVGRLVGALWQAQLGQAVAQGAQHGACSGVGDDRSTVGQQGRLGKNGAVRTAGGKGSSSAESKPSSRSSSLVTARRNPGRPSACRAAATLVHQDRPGRLIETATAWRNRKVEPAEQAGIAPWRQTAVDGPLGGPPPGSFRMRPAVKRRSAACAGAAVDSGADLPGIRPEAAVGTLMSDQDVQPPDLPWDRGRACGYPAQPTQGVSAVGVVNSRSAPRDDECLVGTRGSAQCRYARAPV